MFTQVCVCVYICTYVVFAHLSTVTRTSPCIRNYTRKDMYLPPIKYTYILSIQVDKDIHSHEAPACAEIPSLCGACFESSNSYREETLTTTKL